MNDNDIADIFMRLPALVNQDAALVRRGRCCTTTLMIASGAVPLYLSIVDGKIGDMTRGPTLMRSWRFAIRADADAWRRFWQPLPEPGFNDVLAMSRFGRATIEGDLQPLMANLRYFKEVLEAPRRAALAGVAA